MKPLLLLLSLVAPCTRADTVALWLFDEPEGIYPSSPLADASPDANVLILGRGAEVVAGKFGHALHPVTPAPFAPKVRGLPVNFVDLSRSALTPFLEKAGEGANNLIRFGLIAPPQKKGRTVEPLTWRTATFAAMFTSGESHLRHAPFANATDTRLNLGAGDWTVEFWLKLDPNATNDGVVLEIGTGPRAENDVVTRLVLRPRTGSFIWQNQPAGAPASFALESDPGALRAGWVHCAFVHEGARVELRHYVNGRLRSRASATNWTALPHGDEAYCSIGRDGVWKRPLPAALDELRVSDAALYRDDFVAPQSFSRVLNGSRPTAAPLAGPPQLFPNNAAPAGVVELGSRKHLFLDDVLIADQRNISFAAHPPRITERVLDAHGWISAAQGDDRVIHLFTTGPEDSLLVWTSKDGVHFAAPDLGQGEFHGQRNVVTTDSASVGCAFVDPNGTPQERWKIVTGLRQRGGVMVYTSADGLHFRRNETFALPFWAGSATTAFYDDQRQLYVVHDRNDYFRTLGGHNERCQVLTEVHDLLGPWPFSPMTAEQRAVAARTERLDTTLEPLWLDNGPLAPGSFGLEYPVAFRAGPPIDPVGTDCYNLRAVKYPWAPDAYVAFPLIYFHYEENGMPQREVLGEKERDRGSGIVETQLAVSRDGLTWKRYPRPAYVPIGNFNGYPVLRPYTGYGLVRHGNEIWQYCDVIPSFHSPWEKKEKIPEAIFRLVQRLDGFVSADAPYGGGEFTTRPLRFSGKKLVLNIDTGATGYAQVGLLDEAGRPMPGFSVDDCVYINGNSVDYDVEWLGKGRDVSAFAGRTVRLLVRMRGTSLYALQFVP